MLGLEWGIFLTQRARRKRKGRRGIIHFREFERFFYHKGREGGAKGAEGIFTSEYLSVFFTTKGAKEARRAVRK